MRGKRGRKDVQEFQLHLMDNILSLHLDLKNKTYTHGGYQSFNISDPKPRNIHKATVRDRLLHHAVYRILYPYFDKKFIHDSYSCRLNKGTHKAINQFQRYFFKVSKNNTRQCFVLKCDIKKFFASIDQDILLYILEKHIKDESTISLLATIIRSFHSREKGTLRHAPSTKLGTSQGKKGLPLGNLTSQLLVNIYMNEFDQYLKHKQKIKHYIRYADDFVILSNSKDELTELIPRISDFLQTNLRLSLHPDKVFIRTFPSGVDFLGWVHFPDHRVLRTVTKRRMWRRLALDASDEARQSYLGLLRWGNTEKLQNKLRLL